MSGPRTCTSPSPALPLGSIAPAWRCTVRRGLCPCIRERRSTPSWMSSSRSRDVGRRSRPARSGSPPSATERWSWIRSRGCGGGATPLTASLEPSAAGRTPVPRRSSSNGCARSAARPRSGREARAPRLHRPAIRLPPGHGRRQSCRGHRPGRARAGAPSRKPSGDGSVADPSASPGPRARTGMEDSTMPEPAREPDTARGSENRRADGHRHSRENRQERQQDA